MSSRSLLMEELARAPEKVAMELLAHLRSLMPNSPQGEGAGTDYFESHWKEFYGSLEGSDWEEAPEVPFEQRESW